jgi:hypothetical protein
MTSTSVELTDEERRALGLVLIYSSLEERMPEQTSRERFSEVAVKSIQDRIRSQSAEIGIMGLGYVGLTEAIEFARSGFRVTGFDVDVQRIKNLEAGRSYLSSTFALL